MFWPLDKIWDILRIIFFKCFSQSVCHKYHFQISLLNFSLLNFSCPERSTDFESFRGPRLRARFCSPHQVCKTTASPLTKAELQGGKTAFNTLVGPMLYYILTSLHNIFKTQPQDTSQYLLSCASQTPEGYVGSWAAWRHAAAPTLFRGPLALPRGCQQKQHSSSDSGPV